jgi:hypothetical protein
MKTILRISAISLLLAGSAVALTGERMPELALDKMTPAQRSVADAIMSGPRGGMRGPFNSSCAARNWRTACRRSANTFASTPRSTNASTRWRSA